jgi:hypothetical protein
MYLRKSEPGGGSTMGAAVLAPAAPVAVGGGITVGAVLSAIAFVLSALAAAYVLIRAYEAAKERGFGVALAQRLLTAGLGKLIDAARAAIRSGQRLLEILKRVLRPHPDCAAAIAALSAILATLAQVLAQLEAEKNSSVPRITEMRRLMGEVRQAIRRFNTAVLTALMICRRHHGPELTLNG